MYAPGEPVVYVKVYDSDDAALTQVETLLSQCKSALDLLRLESGDAAPETAKGIEAYIRRPRSGDPLRDAYADDEDDDLDADVFDDFDEPSRRALMQRQENEAYGEDDADDLDAHVASLAPYQQAAPPPRARVSSRRQPEPDPEPPARPARAVQAGAGVRTSRAKLRPGDKDPATGLVVQAPPPKRKLATNAHGIISGANPAAVANAIARGDSGIPKLQTARASRRG